jgi:hypothetical protein
MIPLTAFTPAGSYGDAFDTMLAIIILGVVSVALIANLGAAWEWLRNRRR